MYGRAPPGDYISYDTYRRIVREETTPEYAICYQLCWHTLGRIGEILALTPSAIDDPGCTWRHDGIHSLKVWRQKTKTLDYLPISHELYGPLMQYIREQKIAWDQRLVKKTSRMIEYKMAEKGKVINNLKNIHPHAFRRGGAIYLYTQLKQPLQIIQAMLGHSNLAMTLRYLNMRNIEALSDYAKYLRNS